jgi:hypothetical protein
MKDYYSNLQYTIYITFLVLITHALSAQTTSGKGQTVYVDDKGVMRWTGSKAEVRGFGINYTAPFAHAYRSAKKLNVDLKQAIDNDVYHFGRLGFDAFRVHVWDTEISDSVGNLIVNDHLELFDYMLGQMKARGMKFLLTPIAFWGNGYPDQDEKTPGFSHKYGKDACLTNEDAIQAQERYLEQFLNHKNPVTGVAYKDDPDIVAFEISNEPHHQETPEKVTKYITRMVAAMRKTGCNKPILYNISHSIHLVDAYFKAGIQGGTFQWYPTGLGAQSELGGNLLPNVDQYVIPFANRPEFKRGAKVVYEFDAADVGRSYIYPAMARSFRKAGIQWATHFAYDPTFLAYANTEYNTHYMNLVYAPQKALSLKIASEVFHKVPMYADFGNFPGNATFDAFRVSYVDDLAEMVTSTKFLYTNTTATMPPSPETLTEIAGTGNSPVVKYEGTGAYFLDQIEKGVWRLEVLPDAIWVDNIFGRNSLDKTVAVVNWRTWPMTILLPDLGSGFSIRKLNGADNASATSHEATVEVSPGTWLLVRKGAKTSVTGETLWKNIRLREFKAPATTVNTTYVLHRPSNQYTAGQPVTITATIVSPKPFSTAEVAIVVNGKAKVYSLKNTHAYEYEAVIPAEDINEGFLKYNIILTADQICASYPENASYQVPVISESSPLYLFSAGADHERLSRRWTRTSKVVPLAEPGVAELRVNVEQLFVPDPENRHGEKIFDYSMRYYFRDEIQPRVKELAGKTKLVFKGRSTGDTGALQIALVTKQGVAYGGTVQLTKHSQEHVMPLSEFKQVKLVTLPRPYPSFLPYWFESTPSANFDLSAIETLQLSIGPGIPQSRLHESQGIAIESIRLE